MIGTAGSEEKAALARENGAHHTILYRDEDVAAQVRALTDGRGVNVVYDGVGKDTFDASLDSLAPLGMFVSFGNAFHGRTLGALSVCGMKYRSMAEGLVGGVEFAELNGPVDMIDGETAAVAELVWQAGRGKVDLYDWSGSVW